MPVFERYTGRINFGGLRSLKKIDMWECEALEGFPLGLNNLSKLEELNLSK
jgi:hypothetical protein